MHRCNVLAGPMGDFIRGDFADTVKSVSMPRGVVASDEPDCGLDTGCLGQEEDKGLRWPVIALGGDCGNGRQAGSCMRIVEPVEIGTVQGGSVLNVTVMQTFSNMPEVSVS